jgi:hypothetical protein
MAIALDSTANLGANGGNSYTASFTNTAGNLVIVAIDGQQTASGDTFSSCTYGGDAMTQVSGSPIAKAGRYFYLLYLLAPKTGANNVVATFSSTDQIALLAASYSGVKQTGQPDATNTSQASSVTHNSVSVITVANNCWVVAASRAVVTPTADSGTTLRQSAANAMELFDSGGAVTPAGSKTLGLTFTSADNAMIAASFSPAPDTNNGSFFTIM